MALLAETVATLRPARWRKARGKGRAGMELLGWKSRVSRRDRTGQSDDEAAVHAFAAGSSSEHATRLWLGRVAERGSVGAQKVVRKVAWRLLDAVPPRHGIETSFEAPLEEDGTGPTWLKVTDGPAMIEPRHGYVVAARCRLREESQDRNFPFAQPPWRYGLPPVAIGGVGVRAGRW